MNIRFLAVAGSTLIMSGCPAAPPGGWDEDESGIFVWPAQASEVYEGDEVRIWNQTDGTVECWSAWRVFSGGGGLEIPELEAGESTRVPLDVPRDTEGLPDDDPNKFSARFNCATEGYPAGGTEVLRVWTYTTPPPGET